MSQHHLPDGEPFCQSAQNSGRYHDVRGDLDLDGDIDIDDYGLFEENYDASYYGPSFPGSTAKRFGYAGYSHDEWSTQLSHVRHRVYLPRMGRWTRQDPIGYVDGMNLYEYGPANPLSGSDSNGLNWCETWQCLGSGCSIANCELASNLADWARDEASRLFPDDDNSRDAFRHCYWSCLMQATMDLGDPCPKKIGDLHEECTNNSPAEHQQDYDNNNSGRLFGAQCWMGGPDEDDGCTCGGGQPTGRALQCCRSKCLWALENGHLVTSAKQKKKKKKQINLNAIYMPTFAGSSHSISFASAGCRACEKVSGCSKR